MKYKKVAIRTYTVIFFVLFHIIRRLQARVKVEKFYTTGRIGPIEDRRLHLTDISWSIQSFKNLDKLRSLIDLRKRTSFTETRRKWQSLLKMETPRLLESIFALGFTEYI